jgi:hypothetical protein
MLVNLSRASTAKECAQFLSRDLAWRGSIPGSARLVEK